MAAAKRRTLAWENEYPVNTFTDRDGYKTIMRNTVVAPQAIDEDRALVIYGAGGMGKSALKDYFLREILAKEDLADIVFAAIDFEYEDKTRTVEEATVRIARDLIEKAGIPLPAFSLGFIRYMMKISPETNLQASYTYLFKFKSVDGDLAGYAFEKLIEYGVDEIRAGASLIPGIGFLIKKASERGHGKILEWLQKSSAGKVLQGIDEMLPGELRNKLPVWLAYDLYTYLKAQTDAENEFPSKRIVILMDGFEWLWSKEHHKADKTRELDEWVRQFMQNCPGVTYMIFGREKLNWAQYHPMFGDAERFLQLELKGLEKEDADLYLQKCGVSDEEIRKVMVNNAGDGLIPEEGSLPFYLDIMARTHWAIVQSGNQPAANHFEKLGDEVIIHFFQHLSEEMTTAIKVLSCAPYFDAALMELLASHQFISPSVRMKTLLSFSFIREEGDQAGIHGLMKSLASKMYAEEYPDRFLKVHRTLFDYFDDRLPKEQKEMNSQMEIGLTNAAKSIRILSTAEFRSWIVAKSLLYYGRGSFDAMPVILFQALDDSYRLIRYELGKDNVVLGDRPVEETMELALLNFSMATYYHDWDDQHRAALPYVDQTILICDFYLSSVEHWKFTLHDKSVSQLMLDAYMLKASILSALNKFIKAGKLYAKARAHAGFYGIYFDKAAYGAYLTKTGRFAEAEPLLAAQLAYADDMVKHTEDGHLWFEHTGYLAHDMAKLMREDGRFSEAIQFHERAISVYSQSRQTDHPYVAVVKAELAKTLIKSRLDLDKAESILNEVYPILKRSYEENHLHIAQYYMHIFELYLIKNEVERANEHYIRARNIMQEKIGIESRGSVEGMLRLFLALDEQHAIGEITEEEYLDSGDVLLAAVLPSLDKFKRLFSVYNPILIQILKSCHFILNARNRRDEADHIQRTIRECERIAQQRVAIRFTGFDVEQVLDEKAETMALFSSVVSIPDFDDVDLLKISLPFYATFNLYKIIYKGAAARPKRYVLSDGYKVVPIDFDPLTIKAQGPNLQLDAGNVLWYLRFYYDCVIEEEGFTYILADGTDIPWMLDVETTASFRETVTTSVKPWQIVSNDDQGYQVEAYYITGQQLQRGRFEVGYSGVIKLILSETCYIRETGEIIFLDKFFGEITNDGPKQTYYDHDHNSVKLDKGEALDNTIPACIDPIYEEEVEFSELDAYAKLRQSLQGCSQIVQMIWAFKPASQDQGQDIAEMIESLSSTDEGVNMDWVNTYIGMTTKLMAFIHANLDALSGDLSEEKQGYNVAEIQIVALQDLQKIAFGIKNG